MDNRSSNLLDEALGLDGEANTSWPSGGGGVVVIEDAVDTNASFVMHHLIKRSLSPQNPSSVLIFVAFSQTFSHYDRILRKLGCNLSAQKDSNRCIFFDMLLLQCPDRDEGKREEGGLVQLYVKIQKAITNLPADNRKFVTIVIDDVSLLEAAANGSMNYVLDFLHYCHTLATEFDCSLIALIHEDIYSSMERPRLILQMEYMSDILIKAEPLATGLATDVHGQLTVMNKRLHNLGDSRTKIRNFHFRVKENGVDYFYPGSQR